MIEGDRDGMGGRGGWDVHTHLIPATVLAAGRDRRLGLEHDRAALSVDGSSLPVGRWGDSAELTDWVVGNWLEGALVSPPPLLFRPGLAGTDAYDWVQMVNEGTAAACAADAGRLRPLALLPAPNPAQASAIAADLDDGWAGVVLGTELGGGVYSDSAYDELWDVLASCRLPVFIHPGHCADPRLDHFYLANLLGNPYETTLAAAHLIFGGALERFPSLEVVLAHGGGVVAGLAGRWQRGYETDRPGVARLQLSPIEALRRFHVDTLVHDPRVLALVAELLGSDRLLVGSDWPFPMGVDSVDYMLAGLPSQQARRIRADNARRCYGARLRAP